MHAGLQNVSGIHPNRAGKNADIGIGLSAEQKFAAKPEAMGEGGLQARQNGMGMYIPEPVHRIFGDGQVGVFRDEISGVTDTQPERGVDSPAQITADVLQSSGVGPGFCWVEVERRFLRKVPCSAALEKLTQLQDPRFGAIWTFRIQVGRGSLVPAVFP